MEVDVRRRKATEWDGWKHCQDKTVGECYNAGNNFGRTSLKAAMLSDNVTLSLSDFLASKGSQVIPNSNQVTW